MRGAGKFDKECTEARKSAGAVNAVLIIVDGKSGSGFSVQGTDEFLSRLPDLLEYMAKEVRKDLTKT